MTALSHTYAEARVRAQVGPCGICDGESGTGNVSPPPPPRVLWYFPVNIIPSLLHIHSYIILGMDKGPVRGVGTQRHSLTPSQQQMLHLANECFSFRNIRLTLAQKCFCHDNASLLGTYSHGLPTFMKSKSEAIYGVVTSLKDGL
jgi:hypothetical protein